MHEEPFARNKRPIRITWRSSSHKTQTRSPLQQVDAAFRLFEFLIHIQAMTEHSCQKTDCFQTRRTGAPTGPAATIKYTTQMPNPTSNNSPSPYPHTSFPPPPQPQYFDALVELVDELVFDTLFELVELVDEVVFVDEAVVDKVVFDEVLECLSSFAFASAACFSSLATNRQASFKLTRAT